MFKFKRQSGFSFVLAGVIALLLLLSPAVANAEQEEIGREQLENFYMVLEDIMENYVEVVDIEELERGAIRGMLEELDQHSGYLTPQEVEDFQVRTEGTFGGVGMRLEKVNDEINVAATLSNTPAARAGIKSGDIILEVDGEDVSEYSLRDVVDLIRGEPETSVLITIERNGERMDFSITREIIQLDLVESEIEDNIGYVLMNTFSTPAVSEFNSAISEFQAQDVDGIILDLRNNPGGYLGAALTVASTFVGEEDYLVYVVGKDGKENAFWSTTEPLGIPLVVLVNQASASGSEIVAGAVQDHNKGKVVGVPTPGKASVQTVREFEDGSAYRITIAKYLTPDKRDIDKEGIIPDYTVEDPDEQLARAKDILKKEDGKDMQGVISFTLGSTTATVGVSERELPAQPYTSDGNFMAPLRFLCDSLSGEIVWTNDGETLQVFIKGKKMEFVPGESNAVVEGEEKVMPAPLEIREGTAFVPLRFLAVETGALLNWDSETQKVEFIVR